MDKSESIKEIATALLAVQKEMPTVAKTASNPFFKSKYTPLDKVMPEALKALNKHGISVSQLVSNVEGKNSLTTLLMHSSGEYISGTQPLILAKDDPQGQGSAITYARRYSIMSAIGMVSDDDDDGNKATSGITDLTKKKTELYQALLKAKITDLDQQKLYIFKVLDKETVDSVAEANKVIKDLGDK